MIDVFSRRVVGWQLSKSLRTDLALDAQGAMRTKRFRTTRADPTAARHPDLVRREFSAQAPTSCG